MTENSSTFVPRPVTDVFELNELINDLWLAFPKRKDRDSLHKFVEVVHARLCNQADPNCFFCQHRWNKQMLYFALSKETEEEVSLFPSDQPVGITINQIINEHIRQRHYGLPLTCTPEDLWKICVFEVSSSDNMADGMYSLVRQMEERIHRLSPSQQQELRASGWRPMFKTFDESSGYSQQSEPCDSE